MESNIETIYEDRRGRMRLKIICKPGQYGPRYTSMIYRPYKKEEDKLGNPVWAETHWLDEQDLLNSMRLHDVADKVIAEAKRQQATDHLSEAA